MSEGIRGNDEALLNIIGRQEIILRAISNYLKKNVQIMIYDELLFDEQNIILSDAATKSHSKRK